MKTLFPIALVLVAWTNVACSSHDASTNETGGQAADSTLHAVVEAPPAVRVVHDSVSWPEGPLYHDRSVYYVGYGSHQLWRWDGTTAVEFWSQAGCGPSAVVRLDTGEFLVTCYDSNSLALVGADGRTVANIGTDSAGNTFLGPNDFAKDTKGGTYFSASGVFDPSAPVQGKVYYRAADGTIRLVADGIHYSNGLVVTDDDASLLVAEHLEAQVLKYSIGADGSLSDRRVWKRMDDLVARPADATATYGCDGIKADSKGNIYLTNYGGSRLVVLSQAGRLRHTVEVPYKYVDNVALGPDLFDDKNPPSGGQHLEDYLYIAAVQDESAAPYPGAIFQARNPVR